MILYSIADDQMPVYLNKPPQIAPEHIKNPPRFMTP